MNETTPVRTEGAAARPRFRFGAMRFSMAQFLVALILLLVTEPFVEQMEHGRGIESALLTVVLLSAVPAIGGSRRLLVWGIILVIPAVVTRWLHHTMPDQMPLQYAMGTALLFILFVVANLLRFILRAPRVTAEVLCAGIATYLMLGLLWALAYLLVNRLVPGSFVFTAGPIAKQSMVGFNGLYFSFVTLSTVGYGDIVPVSPIARLLAIAEATVGMIYMTVLIARLVALYSSGVPIEEKETDDENKTT